MDAGDWKLEADEDNITAEMLNALTFETESADQAWVITLTGTDFIDGNLRLNASVRNEETNEYDEVMSNYFWLCVTDNYTAIEPVELSEDPWVGEELDLTGTKTVRHYMNDEEEAEEEELTDVTCKLEYEENEWSVKEGTEATCTETGVRTYTCSVYGEQKTETIPAKGHTPGAAETQSIGQTISPAASRETPVIQAKKTIKKTVKAADLKKKAKKFKIKASANSGGAITFAKVSGSKKITVSSKDKVKVAKNMKKGTYKIRVKISVQANGVYAAGTKTVTVKVKVK